MGLLHALQGFAVLVLSDPTRGVWRVTGDFLQLGADSGVGEPILESASRELFSLNLAYVVAAFFFMSAVAHLLVASSYKKSYLANLDKGINKARWVEYAFSASTMMVGIALLTGVYDLVSLLMIFSLTAIMNLMGLAMEVHNNGSKKVNWLTYNIGVLAGAIPWVVIGIFFWLSSKYGNATPPTFVYYIYASIFLFFNCFAINMVLQYKKIGRWKDYLYGERAYVFLSLFAKSALAWQVFAGTLRP